jgi:hypothetical protein
MDVKAFADRATEFAKIANETERKKLLDELRDLAYSLESPQDSAQRIMYLVLSLAASRLVDTYTDKPLPAFTACYRSCRLRYQSFQSSCRKSNASYRDQSCEVDWRGTDSSGLVKYVRLLLCSLC